ncbi:MAG: ribosome biogenesis GTPase Der [Candidatus Nanopelagicaceae bacterium]|nr:ribosome biogenesis GTPase Der [Candidatus Nanopelagicaceae bacterium]
MTIVVAMDGPSGSGKSSTSKSIARKAGWLYLDTGALYRAATWLAIRDAIVEPQHLVAALEKNPIVFKTDPDNAITLCGGIDVSQEIRSAEITSAVSRISAWPELRAHLLTLQRKIIDSAKNGIVVEGRDIGTVVAPNAQLKIWLQADINARAIRRDLENQERNIGTLGKSQMAESLSQRDALDSNRTNSPLKKAEDAIIVDSTDLTLDETVEYIWNILKQRALIGLPKVVIVGRPNVGKSTLVNRIIGSREAIIEDVPGVTRDRVSYEAEWNGKAFFVVDTGGWEPTSEGIALKISEAAESAIVDADLVLFVVDAQVGQQSDDEAMISVLRKSKKPVMLIANKVDSEKDELEAHSLWNLGLGEPYFISAAHGRGSGDLLDEIVSRLPEVGQSRVDDGFRRVAIVGRPNVGKSSLLNSFAGSVRALVDDAEGTTRDPIDELIDIGDTTWRFIDTAGIRRRAHQASGSDYYATLRTERAIENAEVVIMIIDASVPITEQDLRIISMVEDSGKALVIGMNKWDLVDEDRRVALDKESDRNFDQVEWAARVNISAKTGWHKDKLLPAIQRALDSWEKRVPTAKLNSFLGQLIGSNPPPIRGGKQPKILFATQAGIAPPTFVIFATEFLEASYRRFIERRLREEFGFSGSPIRVSVRIRER